MYAMKINILLDLIVFICGHLKKLLKEYFVNRQIISFRYSNTVFIDGYSLAELKETSNNYGN